MDSSGSSPRMRGKLRTGHEGKTLPRLIPAYAGKTATLSTWCASTRAHPRVCGENDKDPYSDETLSGSSPRMRGKRFTISRGIWSPGLIPAYAGKTRKLQGNKAGRKAHPRVCGENPVDTFSGSPSTGSSPRMRGKLKRSIFALTISRLIPAYAGKTRRVRRARYSVRAHPRVCGENGNAVLWAGSGGGSSPRMRGKLGEAFLPILTKGLIPAYAGKTWTHAH